MAATLSDHDATPDEHSTDATPATLDLGSTTDLHEEDTSDLTSRADAGGPNELARAPTAAGEEPDDEASAYAEPSVEHAASRNDGSLAPGMILKNRFLLEDIIGAGGACVVYRARDIHAAAGGELVRIALKAPRPESHDANRAAQRLTHEFELAQRLTHPHIVRVLELHTQEPPHFMTLELIEGKALSSLLRDRRPAPAALARKILQQSAAALAYAHRREVVHGDFKPGNVLLTRDDDVKVIDFGAAVAPLSAETRIAAGTPTYASPEVLSGELPEVRDDVFSFACVAYELLTGRHPFDRASSLQARAEGRLPPRVWSVSASQWLALLAALSWRREQRPHDLEELAAALCTADGATTTTRVRPSSELMGSELSEDMMPAQRSWGFFAFVACALGVTYLATQSQTDQTLEADRIAAPAFVQDAVAEPAFGAPRAPPGVLGAPAMNSSPAPFATSSPLAAKDEVLTPSSAAGEGPGEGPTVDTDQSAEPSVVEQTSRRSAPPAPRSQISFGAPSIVTSEGAVAAVFVVKRSQPLSGRARVKWKAISGTADAGVDFASDAAGTIEFADGQAQRAIYLPLRNDLLPEEHETFTVRLESPQNARLGSPAELTATILDDDR